jgi:hypothetical protein
MIQHIRSQNASAMIIGNLAYNTFLDDLYEAGANYVMLPHLLGGQWMSEIIREKKWTAQTFEMLKKTQREEMKLRFSSGVQKF